MANVVTAESCECVVDGGQLLGGVDPAWLETVIPKQPPMVVMVVRGRYNGQVSLSNNFSVCVWTRFQMHFC